MKFINLPTNFILYCLTTLLCVSNLSAADSKLDTAAIEKITGSKGTFNEQEGVFKVSFPRSDIKISVGEFQMPPFMGLTSWAGFQKGTRSEAMVMGDLVLFQDEVNSAMSAALNNNLEVTALHNHFFYDEPKVFFMHIGGEGSSEQLATGVKRALEAVKKIRSAEAQPARTFGGKAIASKSSITAKPLEDILGVKGTSKDGMFKAVFGRKAKMPCGCDVGKEMGVNTWAAFAGTDDNAVADGDFVVKETELQNVLKILRNEEINVVAIHHHMIQENPRYLFLHYWGKGKAEELANAIHTALQATL